MENREALEMMNRCLYEIEDLRRRISTLQPKAEAYEIIGAIVELLPRKQQGMSPDLSWELKKRIAELQPKPKANE